MRIERRNSRDEFVCHCAQTPPIHTAPLLDFRGSQQNLGSEIVGRAVSVRLIWLVEAVDSALQRPTAPLHREGRLLPAGDAAAVQEGGAVHWRAARLRSRGRFHGGYRAPRLVASRVQGGVLRAALGRLVRWVQALSSPLGKARHGQAKVGKADVPVAADEEVVWLDVAVNDAHRVDVLQRQHRLRDVLPRRVLLKAAHALYERGAVPAVVVLHHHVKVVLRGEGVEAPHHVGRTRRAQNVSLSAHLVYHVLDDHVFLLQHLKGKQVPCCVLAGQVNSSKRALTKGLHDGKVVNGGALTRGGGVGHTLFAAYSRNTTLPLLPRLHLFENEGLDSAAKGVNLQGWSILNRPHGSYIP
mmetsp:Transcript_37862/g.72551  ORF Transcript_37862/g.72551 Transcript_37862/m.72551 type:complete len:356 (+) Transcript_37862:1276-2343(+)